jgi:hypothetical protein
MAMAEPCRRPLVNLSEIQYDTHMVMPMMAKPLSIP